MDKSKKGKRLWVKSKKRPGPKKRGKKQFDKGQLKNLAESDKGRCIRDDDDVHSTSIKPGRYKNSDIELKACNGVLQERMIYKNRDVPKLSLQ